MGFDNLGCSPCKHDCAHLHKILPNQAEQGGTESYSWGTLGCLPPFQGLDGGGHLYRGFAAATPRPVFCQPFGLAIGQ